MDEAGTAGWAGRDDSMVAFLRDAVAPLGTRKLLVPVTVLVILLTASNIFILETVPDKGGLRPAFIAAALLRIGGLIMLEVGVMRILTASPRRAWSIDGAYALFLPLFILTSALSAGAQKAIGDGPAELLIGVLVAIVLLAPLAAWGAAMAVARPLAWRPGPYMRRFGRWLPQTIVWSVILVSPLAILHVMLDHRLIAGAGEWFWFVALVDGPLSAVIALLGVSFNAAAYRRIGED